MPVAIPTILRDTWYMQGTNSTALIFIGGEHPDRAVVQFLAQGSVRFLAADGGYDTALALGFQPEMIIGDMDSVRALPLENDLQAPKVHIERWPAEKDWTDTELALAWAWDHGLERCILIGGGGGRMDHLLGIYALFQREHAPLRWYTAHDELILVKDHMSFLVGVGTELSFFPLGDVPCQIQSQGLKWELNALSWSIGDCGLSNRSTQDTIYLKPESGRALMVRRLGRHQKPLASEWS